MADTYAPEVRSRVMARVKAQDTGPEIHLRKALFAAGFRGWRCNRRSLPGKPDIAFGRRRVAIFVDGAFWHGHPSKYWPGRTSEYWDEKIKRNQDRDRRVSAELEDMGWQVLRFWDFEVETDTDAVIRRIKAALPNVAEEPDE